MKIKFGQPYKSIRDFNDIEIKNFSILLGVNGAGKTHLLKAIQEGFVFADNIQKEKISYFNLQTFLIKNQNVVAQRNIDDEKMLAWTILNDRKDKFKIFDDQISSIVGEKDFPYESEVPEEQKVQYEQHKIKILDFINSRTGNNLKIKRLLKTGIFESGKYASKITQREFFKHANYSPDDYELLESLSEVFLDYQKKLTISKLAKSDGGEGLQSSEIQKLEIQSPWNFVSGMFKEFGLNHTMTYPDFTAGDIIRTKAVPFQVKLLINDQEIDFADLSSGEKILCALAVTVYQDNKSEFPDLLLLDEVDASLHPSMIQHLLDVIENVFIKNGCKVILASHSPTTVALASEETLFEVQIGKIQQKIKKISQSAAINLLSEGIITFEKGLKIQKSFDKSKKLQILTEGNNTEHIKQAVEILDNTLLTKIKIIDGAPDKRGGQQLKNAFDAMSLCEYEGRFLFVWDCDFASKMDGIHDTESFKKFCFAENTENTKRGEDGKAKGIENLYPEDLFTEEVYSTTEIPLPHGGSKTERKFDKGKFLQKIQAQNNQIVFKNFQPLIDKIKVLLED